MLSWKSVRVKSSSMVSNQLQRKTIPRHIHDPLPSNTPPTTSVPSTVDLLTSITNLSPKVVDPSCIDLLNQLTTTLQRSPTMAPLQTWEKVGVVPKLVELEECGVLEVEQQARLNLSLLGYPPRFSGRGLRILSIDGGGTR